jgi:hypothetical protein
MGKWEIVLKMEEFGISKEKREEILKKFCDPT